MIDFEGDDLAKLSARLAYMGSMATLEIGPLLAAVLDAEAATVGVMAGAELAGTADRLVAHAATHGCDVLIAAAPDVERLLGAALMRGQGQVRALGPNEHVEGLKVLVVDAVVAGAARLWTVRDAVIAAGAAHVETVACGSRGPAEGSVAILG